MGKILKTPSTIAKMKSSWESSRRTESSKPKVTPVSPAEVKRLKAGRTMDTMRRKRSLQEEAELSHKPGYKSKIITPTGEVISEERQHKEIAEDLRVELAMRRGEVAPPSNFDTEGRLIGDRLHLSSTSEMHSIARDLKIPRKEKLALHKDIDATKGLTIKQDQPVREKKRGIMDYMGKPDYFAYEQETNLQEMEEGVYYNPDTSQYYYLDAVSNELKPANDFETASDKHYKSVEMAVYYRKYRTLTDKQKKKPGKISDIKTEAKAEADVTKYADEATKKIDDFFTTDKAKRMEPLEDFLGSEWSYRYLRLMGLNSAMARTTTEMASGSLRGVSQAGLTLSHIPQMVTYEGRKEILPSLVQGIKELPGKFVKDPYATAAELVIMQKILPVHKIIKPIGKPITNAMNTAGKTFMNIEKSAIYQKMVIPTTTVSGKYTGTVPYKSVFIGRSALTAESTTALIGRQISSSVKDIKGSVPSPVPAWVSGIPDSPIYRRMRHGTDPIKGDVRGYGELIQMYKERATPPIFKSYMGLEKITTPKHYLGESEFVLYRDIPGGTVKSGLEAYKSGKYTLGKELGKPDAYRMWHASPQQWGKISSVGAGSSSVTGTQFAPALSSHFLGLTQGKGYKLLGWGDKPSKPAAMLTDAARMSEIPKHILEKDPIGKFGEYAMEKYISKSGKEFMIGSKYRYSNIWLIEHGKKGTLYPTSKMIKGGGQEIEVTTVPGTKMIFKGSKMKTVVAGKQVPIERYELKSTAKIKPGEQVVNIEKIMKRKSKQYSEYMSYKKPIISSKLLSYMPHSRASSIISSKVSSKASSRISSKVSSKASSRISSKASSSMISKLSSKTSSSVSSRASSKISSKASSSASSINGIINRPIPPIPPIPGLDKKPKKIKGKKKGKKSMRTYKIVNPIPDILKSMGK